MSPGALILQQPCSADQDSGLSSQGERAETSRRESRREQALTFCPGESPLGADDQQGTSFLSLGEGWRVQFGEEAYPREVSPGQELCKGLGWMNLWQMRSISLAGGGLHDSLPALAAPVRIGWTGARHHQRKEVCDADLAAMLEQPVAACPTWQREGDREPQSRLSVDSFRWADVDIDLITLAGGHLGTCLQTSAVEQPDQLPDPNSHHLTKMVAEVPGEPVGFGPLQGL